MLKSINSFIALFIDTFKLFGRLKAWLLLLCILFVNWLLLYSHYQFTEPLFYSTVTWWTELWDVQYAGGFTHYPGHFILLAYYYSSAKLFIGFLLEGGLLGAVAVVFYKHIYANTDKINTSIKEKIMHWFHLSLAWGFLNGVLFAGYTFFPQILESFLDGSPRRQLLFEYGAIPLFNIIIVALFFFAIPYIAIYRTNVISGLKNSLLMFFKRPIYILFLSGVILSVPILISFILADSVELVSKFKPVMIYVLLLISIVVDLLVNFFWIGTAVNYLSEDD